MDYNLNTLQQSMKYLLFITVGLLVLFIILLIINFTLAPISFLSFISFAKKEELLQEDPPPKPETFGLIRPLLNDQTLAIKSEDYKSKDFTLCFDCYVSRNYKSIDVPRVLFYFGGSTPVVINRNSDLKETKLTDASNNGLDIQPNILTTINSDLPTMFTNTNFIIYLDPIRNDMKIGIFLHDNLTPPTKYMEVLPVIKNVPIEQPFQIGFVLGETFAEIYKDKKLLFTHHIGSILKKEQTISFNPSFAPVQVLARTSPLTASPNLYGPISFIADTVKVGNVQFFTTKLDSRHIRSLTNDILQPNFFKRL